VDAGDLMARARAGDGDAFNQLTEPYRRELQVHCYRKLGSFQDAEDALQDTLLSVWQGLGGFEGRSSLRTWLYRIATNRCLNARRSTSRRQAKEWDVPGVEPPRVDSTWRSSLVGAVPQQPPRRGTRSAAGRRSPLRADRVYLSGLRDRPPGSAAAPGCRSRLARRARVPRQRSRRHAGLEPLRASATGRASSSLLSLVMGSLP
jgi:RNA polymerase sigma factor (sigma-70 family)